MTKEELFDKVAGAIAKVTGISAAEITMESNLMDDLELSSMEIYMSLSSLEEALSVRYTDRVIMDIMTVEDLVNVTGELVDTLHGKTPAGQAL